jgi:sulfur carrier protein ThiS
MEAIIKKTISIEFEGTKYAIPDDATVEDLLSVLDIPNKNMVKLKATKEGFLLMR